MIRHLNLATFVPQPLCDAYYGGLIFFCFSPSPRPCIVAVSAVIFLYFGFERVDACDAFHLFMVLTVLFLVLFSGKLIQFTSQGSFYSCPSLSSHRLFGWGVSNPRRLAWLVQAVLLARLFMSTRSDHTREQYSLTCSRDDNSAHINAG